jgi:enoyl-CoA hydratase/carnithine racemase
MRFAVRQNAILGPPEVGFGISLGVGGVQHLGRLLGRGHGGGPGCGRLRRRRAERYGWVNPALPDAEPDAFVARLARRIASFPAEAVRSTNE